MPYSFQVGFQYNCLASSKMAIFLTFDIENSKKYPDILSAWIDKLKEVLFKKIVGWSDIMSGYVGHRKGVYRFPFNWTQGEVPRWVAESHLCPALKRFIIHCAVQLIRWYGNDRYRTWNFGLQDERLTDYAISPRFDYIYHTQISSLKREVWRYIFKGNHM